MAAKGKALDWTDTQLEEIAVVSEADQETAKVFWQKHAPDDAKELLNATTEDIPVE